ncbi:DUF4870 domain-containing protein [Microbacteriaceae bacterium VKM Ac-2855]|nr:DUF4870 domain-containing protein [Microbacteriaceae bacterium VKM Ac-2855]
MDDRESLRRTRDRQAARLMWLAGLASIAGFLIVSPLLSLPATLLCWATQRQNGPLATDAGIEALNWQLTYFALQIMLVPLHLALVTVQRATGEAWPLLTISALLLIGTVNLLVSIVYAIRAGRGKRTRLVLALPFIHHPSETR